jgi:hypothetical protein
MRMENPAVPSHQVHFMRMCIRIITLGFIHYTKHLSFVIQLSALSSQKAYCCVIVNAFSTNGGRANGLRKIGVSFCALFLYLSWLSQRVGQI